MKLLKEMNFELYASLGTADFYSAHGVEVRSENITLHFSFVKLLKYTQTCISLLVHCI